jgi:hypothetical protein
MSSPTVFSLEQLWDEVFGFKDKSQVPWSDFKKISSKTIPQGKRGFKKHCTEVQGGKLIMTRNKFINTLKPKFPQMIKSNYALGDIKNKIPSTIWVAKMLLVEGFYPQTTQFDNLPNGTYAIRFTGNADMMFAIEYKDGQGNAHKLGVKLENDKLVVSPEVTASNLNDLINNMSKRDLKNLKPYNKTNSLCLDQEEEQLLKYLKEKRKDNDPKKPLLMTQAEAEAKFLECVNSGIETVQELKDDEEDLSQSEKK